MKPTDALNSSFY